MDEREVDLPERAWNMIDTLLETGWLVLGDGSKRQANTKEILSAAQFAASRKPREQRSVPALDHLIGKTDV